MDRRRMEMGRGVRLALLASLVVMGLVAVLATGAEDAAACTRTSLNGTVRKCTLTENFGQCVRDSEDAYWQCRRRNPGFWGSVGCSLANNLDQVSCVFSSGAFGVVRGARGALGG